ncbi:unnamed protein product [Tetraodon nigroviridis]|uniref:(spotted green pufferfish) hypothetical protein n=1 Tax=Tetraodon nigroviridis TaxID=99883 RepID=Q4SGZ1_TETNG|nr:unnamed protein product [Tetraodon nigroviridis]
MSVRLCSGAVPHPHFNSWMQLWQPRELDKLPPTKYVSTTQEKL